MLRLITIGVIVAFFLLLIGFVLGYIICALAASLSKRDENEKLLFQKRDLRKALVKAKYLIDAMMALENLEFVRISEDDLAQINKALGDSWEDEG